VSFTPNAERHQPRWVKGEVGEFCIECGRDREVPNPLHMPAGSPFTKAVAKAFGNEAQR
jgi:hypothetical protein